MMASGDGNDIRGYDANDDQNSATGTSYQEAEWQKVNRRKRKRFNTGPAELSHFHTLSGDDKLAILFEKLVDIEEKLPSVRELQSTVETVRQRTTNAETSIKSHEQQIKVLNYKSVDIEARSRRKNLIFRGLYEGSTRTVYLF